MASRNMPKSSGNTGGRVPPRRSQRVSARSRASTSTSSNPTAAANPAVGSGVTPSTGASTSTTSTAGPAAVANPSTAGTSAAGGGTGAGVAPEPASRPDHGRVVRVGNDWKYECQCGSRMANHPRNIGSHMTKMHKPNSSYNQHRKAFKNNIPCQEAGCDVEFPNKHGIVHHYRRRHDYTGDSTPLLERYGF
ncbi:hypothetical protein F4810DRAFT_111057 [Camillea tinctor]|nr:hypothetical protein F4810DRAFT_111057 [Camillea tinctor]